MAVQFAGSGSAGNRRRRRLAVDADATGVDSSLLEGEGGEIESELVASAAAAPWVPVTEFRIWIYAALIGICLGTLSFLLARPVAFAGPLAPVVDHLLGGPRPLAVTSTQAFLLALSTQMGILICWYRAQCRLDFGGRYRVWPWVVGLIGVGALCTATDLHHVLGEVLGHSDWLPWRGSTVAWLLPFWIAALPIALLIDRDVRNSRSSLWMLRVSGLLWFAEALLEIYQTELASSPLFKIAYPVVPLFASATLFVGMWLHARIVAYVCPDPPELEERSAWSILKGSIVWIAGGLMFWRRANVTAQDEEETKPKRRRKKAEGDETAAKRKRRTAAKRPSRARAKTKLTDEEETGEEASDDELESLDDSGDASWEQATEPSEEELEQLTAPAPQATTAKSNDRYNQVDASHGSSIPAPHSRYQSSSWKDEQADESDESSDDGDDDGDYQNDVRISPEQMKGLSKRQKRDLRKQLREQQRTRGR